MTRLIIIGAGGHGAVVAEAAAMSEAWESIGFLDDNPRMSADVVGCPVLGNSSLLTDFVHGDNEFVVAIGDNHLREEVLSSIREQHGVLANIVHPSAFISPSVSIAPGGVIFAGVVINARTSIGQGCIVNTSASIDHDSVLGSFVHISPGAHLSGGVHVGNRSWLGIGSSVREGVKIGDDVVVGAGAAVVSDVPSNSTVVGVPARPVDQ